MKIAIKLFVTLFLLGTSLHAQGANAEAIISKMIKAYGGEANLKQLNDYEQLWKIEAKTNNKNGTNNRKVMMPAYLYTKLQCPH